MTGTTDQHGMPRRATETVGTVTSDANSAIVAQIESEVLFIQKEVNRLGVRSVHDREDLVQEICRICLARVSKYDAARASVRTWIRLQICTVVGKYRNRHRIRTTTDFSRVADRRPDGVRRFDDETCAAELLSRLPRRQREYMMESCVRNRPLVEIASEFEVARSTVSSAISRARRRLAPFKIESLG